ncbi:AI-2E family transporter [Halovivax ruber]|uniref:AI-2E family transporter n=1 Tax=Halovivax ruber TaxID=387341 RepID=UPI0026884ADB
MSERRRWDGHRLVWIALGLVLAVAVGFALSQYIGAVLFALFLYYATRPAYRRLNRHLDHPNIVASVTILLVVLPMLVIVAYAGSWRPGSWISSSPRATSKWSGRRSNRTCYRFTRVT